MAQRQIPTLVRGTVFIDDNTFALAIMYQRTTVANTHYQQTEALGS
ncbi:TPA: hypothetical protein N2R15_005216 [Citrobacter amalonaticus]|nr:MULTISPECIES: hypothetical protein [Citrobacter]EKZ2526212.1 hypothetical protein [Citrobacter farmeri]MDM2737208.1 hypothetical protein [Citrobacter sp. Ct235]CAI9397488.1 hypothetical protein CITSP_02134 [Citrobacter sp. T1.2D-1]HCL6630383.1 hypothetical protein [Citrobacter amalonaticus]